MKKVMMTVAVIATLMFSCTKQHVEPKKLTIEEKNAPFQNKFGDVTLYTSDTNEPCVWVSLQSLNGKGNWVFYQAQTPECKNGMTLTLKVGEVASYTVCTYVDPVTKADIKTSWTKTVTVNYEGECRAVDIKQ